MIHYPEFKNNSAGLRAEAHEDINLITLLIGTEQEGLDSILEEDVFNEELMLVVLDKEEFEASKNSFKRSSNLLLVMGLSNRP